MCFLSLELYLSQNIIKWYHTGCKTVVSLVSLSCARLFGRNSSKSWRLSLNVGDLHINKYISVQLNSCSLKKNQIQLVFLCSNHVVCSALPTTLLAVLQQGN